jgi:hypothetical protein
MTPSNFICLVLPLNRSIAGKHLIEHGDYLKFLDETGFVPQ